jgi:opacity protein-like surface antigen
MIRQLLSSTVLILLVASSAQAQRSRTAYPSRADRWEFSLQTRFTFGQEFNAEGGSSVRTQDDLGWAFGFAYNFDQHWNLGFGFGWRSLPYTANVVGDVDPPETVRYSSNLSISTIGVSGTWHVLDGTLSPYATGGLGWTLIDTNIFAGFGSGCWWDPWWGYRCGSFPTTYGKDAWTLAVGGGLRAELTDAFFLLGGYEYRRNNSSLVEAAHMIRVDLGLMFDAY